MEGYRNLLSEDCLGSAKILQGLVRYVQSPAPLSDRNRLLDKGWGVGNCLKYYETNPLPRPSHRAASSVRMVVLNGRCSRSCLALTAIKSGTGPRFVTT
jgi:hypothetical protein